MFSTNSTSKSLSRRSRKIVSRSSRNARRGGAAVEAAICFPLIVLIMMGTLEACAGIYLKESITICAFEGTRVGVRRNGTAQDVRDTVLAALADRQVIIPGDDSSLGVTITPSNFDSLDALDEINVQIVAPTAGNSLYIFDSFVNRNVSCSVTMVREFDE